MTSASRCGRHGFNRPAGCGAAQICRQRPARAHRPDTGLGPGRIVLRGAVTGGEDMRVADAAQGLVHPDAACAVTCDARGLQKRRPDHARRPQCHGSLNAAAVRQRQPAIMQASRGQAADQLDVAVEQRLAHDPACLRWRRRDRIGGG